MIDFKIYNCHFVRYTANKQAGNILGFRCICSGRSNSWCVGICVIQKLLTV